MGCTSATRQVRPKQRKHAVCVDARWRLIVLVTRVRRRSLVRDENTRCSASLARGRSSAFLCSAIPLSISVVAAAALPRVPYECGRYAASQQRRRFG